MEETRQKSRQLIMSSWDRVALSRSPPGGPAGRTVLARRAGRPYRSALVWMYDNISNTLFDQKSPVHREVGFPRWHTQTTDVRCNLQTDPARSVIFFGRGGFLGLQVILIVV